MELDVTSAELTHIERSVKTALMQFEAVATWGCHDFDNEIFDLRLLLAKIDNAFNELES